MAQSGMAQGYAQMMEVRRENIQAEIMFSEGVVPTWPLGRSMVNPAEGYMDSMGVTGIGNDEAGGRSLLEVLAHSTTPEQWSVEEGDRSRMMRGLASEALDGGLAAAGVEPRGQGLRVGLLLRPCARLVLVVGTSDMAEVEGLERNLRQAGASQKGLRLDDDAQGPRLVVDSGSRRSSGARVLWTEPLHGAATLAWELMLVQTMVDCVVTVKPHGEQWPKVVGHVVCESHGYSDRLRKRWEWSREAGG